MSKRTSRVKGQGNVYMRSYSPYWQISYWNGWRQQRESSCTKDYGEAVKTLQRKLGEIAVGRSAGAERIKVAALLKLVVEDYRRHDRADLLEVTQRVENLLHPYFGDMRAAAFSTRTLNNYIEFRQKDGKKNATINRELALLRRSFRLGYEHDPQLVFRLPVIKMLPEDNVREGFLEADKYKLILDALTDENQARLCRCLPSRHAHRRTARAKTQLGRFRGGPDIRERPRDEESQSENCSDLRRHEALARNAAEPWPNRIAKVRLAVLTGWKAGQRFQSGLETSLRKGGSSRAAFS